MANKPRTPMTTGEEIVQWAEQTKAANGVAFTMLNKEEQLLIAKFILAMRDHIKTLQSNLGGAPAPAPAQSAEPVSEPMEEPKPVDEPAIVERPPAKEDKRQTNMEYCKANDVPMQRAYQMFIAWQNLDPTNRMIVDEARKAYINSAAFAFWLNLPHE